MPRRAGTATDRRHASASATRTPVQAATRRHESMLGDGRATALTCINANRARASAARRRRVRRAPSATPLDRHAGDADEQHARADQNLDDDRVVHAVLAGRGIVDRAQQPDLARRSPTACPPAAARSAPTRAAARRTPARRRRRRTPGDRCVHRRRRCSPAAGDRNPPPSLRAGSQSRRAAPRPTPPRETERTSSRCPRPACARNRASPRACRTAG